MLFRSPLTLAATLDKDMAKILVRAVGVVVPGGLTVSPAVGRDQTAVRALIRDLSQRVAYPWIVKPALEGSSKGIRARCLADNEDEAADLLSILLADYEQPILIEEFIVGDEVTVGLIGEADEPETLGVMRIYPRSADKRFVYSLDMKRNWRETMAYEAPAQLSAEASAVLVRSAERAYRALGCRDVARIDFRIRDGIPHFLEANPLPGLSPEYGDLVFLARGAGLTHADLIRRILGAALRRINRTKATTEARPR